MRTTLFLIALFAVLCYLIISAVLPAGAAPTSARATFTPAPERTSAPLATPMPTPTSAPYAYPAPEEKGHSEVAPIQRDTPCRPKIGVRLVCQ